MASNHGYKNRMEKTIERLRDSHDLKRLKRHYKIDIFPRKDGVVIRVCFGNRRGGLDLIDIIADAEGMVFAESALHYLTLGLQVV